MKNFSKISIHTWLVLVSLLIFTSCKKEKLTPAVVNTPPMGNIGPEANAGADQIIILPKDSVELIGSGTDIDGMIVSSEWTKLRGPSQFTLVSSSGLITKAINLVEGRYEFQLNVTDNGGLTAKDIVVITVLNSSGDPCYGCWDY